MSKQDLAALALQLFMKKQDRSELVEQKDKIEEPEKPKEPATYEQAQEFHRAKQRYSHRIKEIDNKLSRLDTKINEIENDIKGIMPTSNIKIELSGKIENVSQTLIIEHVNTGRDDRIEVREK